MAQHSVLDIGAVEHSLYRTEYPDWKHGRIKKIAARVVGVDILGPEIQALNAKDFDIREVDATSDIDLAEKFSRVVIGDVIEHVDSPVALLKFAKRHLTQDGLILVQTPTPFFWKHMWITFKEKTFIANAEHTAWMTPSMAIELASRSGLELASVSHFGTRVNSLSKFIKKYLTLAIFGKNSELQTHAFAYIFKHSQ